MHIDKLRIDRFGDLADVQIDSLTDGLNVLYGSTNTCTQTVAQFISAMLCGFHGDIRRRFLPTESRGFGGAATMQTTAGRHTISRCDDGSRDGRLTVQYPDGRVIGCHNLREFVGVTDATFDHVFSLDFDRPTGIEALVREIQACQSQPNPEQDSDRRQRCTVALQEQRERLAALPVISQPVDHLQLRHGTLREEIDALETRTSEEGSNRSYRLTALDDEITHLDQQLASLKEQLQSTSRLLDDLASRRMPIRNARTFSERPDGSLDTLHESLSQVDSRIDRWRGVLQEVTQRRQALQATEEDRLVNTAVTGPDAADPRRVLQSIESQIQHLQACVGDLHADPVEQACQCRMLRDMFGAALNEMCQDVYRLCQALSCQQEVSSQQDCSNEVVQLERCEAELRAAIQRLAEQRRNVRSQIVAHQSDDASLHDWQGSHCRCQEHPQARPTVTSEETEANAVDDEREQLENEINRLELRQEQLLADIDDMQTELSTLHEQRQRLECAVPHFHAEKLADMQAELRGVERDLEVADHRRQLHQAIAELEDQLQRLEPTPLEPIIPNDASEYLRRLSAGNLIQIGIDQHNRVWVVDENRINRPYAHITAGQQDQAYLSVCLALVAAYKRRGVSLPLVLNGAFTNLTSNTASETAELLRDFAGHGHQVVVFTRYERVASVFRLLNINVRHLPTTLIGSESSTAPVHRPAPPVEMPLESASIIVEEAVEHLWDSEEFPGELTDRVRVQAESPIDKIKSERQPRIPNIYIDAPIGSSSSDARTVPYRSPAPIDSGEFFLTERHPIEYAPSIDSANVDRLRKIGILRVGDLLRVAASDAVADLRGTGVTIEMIETWKAQSLLVCRVPRLRPYDARVLVACGIRTPGQLTGTKPSTLRDIVRNFATSSAGQAVLMSGTEYELSRVTEWISSAQGLKAPSQPRKHDRFSPARPSRAEIASPQRGRRSPKRGVNRPSNPAAEQAQPERPPQPTQRTSPQAKPSPPSIIKLEEQTNWRFFLDRSADVVDAPSIGPKTAERLATIGIRTVDDLLKADAAAIAEKLQNRRIRRETVEEWQLQTTLAVRVPQLRGHDAQILVALEITDPEELAQADPETLWARVGPFVESKEGKRIIRNGKEPDPNEVRDWIHWAQAARALNAA